MSAALNSADIALVVDELSTEWTGAQVQKVHMRGAAVVLLGLRAPGRGGVLHLSVEPLAGTLFVTDERGPVDPEPSAFCMLLRRLLKGRRLAALEQLGGDRVVRLAGKDGHPETRTLGSDAFPG